MAKISNEIQTFVRNHLPLYLKKALRTQIKAIFLMNPFYSRTLLLLASVVASVSLWAQGPNGSGTYYENANGRNGEALKTAMAGIINPHKVLDYSELWECYKTTDVRPDGKIRDRYSATTDFIPGEDQDRGSHRKEGDTYNREHSFPKSWFNDMSPMVTDLYHIYPTDSYVNEKRGNYPFGENSGERYQSDGAFSKLGDCTFKGYGGIVFEPADEWKGDFARTYFYMVTCYENKVKSWQTTMTDGSTYPALKEWALNLLMKWSREDPVDSLESARNIAVNRYQGNRNPFIDYPGLEEYIWGEKKEETFDYTVAVAPVKQIHTKEGNGTLNPGENPDPSGTDDPIVTPDPAEGGAVYTKVSDASALEIGGRYLIVYEKGAMAMGAQSSKVRSNVPVTITDDKITTATGADGKPCEIVLQGAAGAYQLYDAGAKTYLACSTDANVLSSVARAGEATALWTITFSEGNAMIVNHQYGERSICYNSGNPRFACYKSASSQQPVALYKLDKSAGINTVGTATTGYADVFDMTGRLVRQHVEAGVAVRGLQPGVYLVNGKKIVIR